MPLRGNKNRSITPRDGRKIRNRKGIFIIVIALVFVDLVQVVLLLQLPQSLLAQLGQPGSEWVRTIQPDWSDHHRW